MRKVDVVIVADIGGRNSGVYTHLAITVVVACEGGAIIADNDTMVSSNNPRVNNKTAADGAAVTATHDTARIIVGPDVGTIKDDVFHGAANDMAEKTLVVVRRQIDLNIFYDVVITIEVTTEGVVLSAYSGIVVTTVVFCKSDVISELKEITIGVACVWAEVIAVVYTGGQLVEIVRRRDDVGMPLAAVGSCFAAPITTCVIAGEGHSDGSSTLVGVAPHIMDSAAKAGNGQWCAGIEAVADFSLEGEHVGAGARFVGESTPCGDDSRCVLHINDFAERHTEVERVTRVVGTCRDLDIALDDRRIDVVNGLDVGLEVLDLPSVVVLAGGIETYAECLKAGICQHAGVQLVVVLVARLNPLGVEASYRVFVSLPFHVMTAEVDVGSGTDGEGIVGIIGVHHTWVMTEAS